MMTIYGKQTDAKDEYHTQSETHFVYGKSEQNSKVGQRRQENYSSRRNPKRDTCVRIK